MKFEGFNWDKGNSDKCTKHGLRREDIESFFLQEEIYVAPDLKHSSEEERFLAIGKGPKKMIVVAFTFRNRRGKRTIRPISARFMNKKEVQRYEETFKKNKDK
ncbi:MAG: BrnT family toxin [Bdellovibrionales bacterium]|nr:BrnT family toxin [Bdellovibrionales bacterium]